ncbi:tricarballylate utilization 4Fe-4S protein TcuB [Lentibacter algarum]|uniref:tricarballylate utilization 4Fe-4S protein TcuB n=1 Tax=Lentibacter algarum TaxID=576131 RepID=UPI001C06BEF6|nr:tricarballylate utilization 4Fe-4S protein TcuB [Lentibacter algarum]MBU2980191.1 tricarballylate utilization 4Fe-4S protein TcuB [Lentibacter algarum]
MLMPDQMQEARRQVEICNACRYCEGYCSVFPSIMREKSFSDGDLTHLANLCHNCQGCFYACQYTEPHEFALNLPAILAEVRQESWERLAMPQSVARVMHRRGGAIAGLSVAAFAVFFVLMQWMMPEDGVGFYAHLSHVAMITLFTPAFLLPLVSVAFSLRAYWREVEGGKFRLRYFLAACKDAANMRNLSGGQGQGCNYEDEDRFSNMRRWFHQATMYGFLLCFASTSSGTIMHYLFAMPAPYALFSLPKILGVSGGVLLVIGCFGLAWLKTKADPALGAKNILSGEYAFIFLLGATGLTGLMLYAATGTGFVGGLLAVHLGFVLTLFLLIPFSKMAHGFYRMTALTAEAAKHANAN